MCDVVNTKPDTFTFQLLFLVPNSGWVDLEAYVTLTNLSR